MDFIFTCQKISTKLAIQELELKDKSFNFIKWLDEGVGLARTNFSSCEFKEFVIKMPVIFIRHIFKVDSVLSLKSNWKHKILQLSKKNLIKDKTFSIQLRHSKNTEFETTNLANELSSKIEDYSFVLDIKDSNQVVSIYLDSEDIYFGIDNVENNLSKFKGGVPHYLEQEDFISRAEFKMVEALDCFNINTTNLKEGADFGAAPGGWTKVLAQKGINMIAIDPAQMNEKVTKLINVTHKRMTIQEYFFNHNDKRFDIIVNDMKMDVKKSVNLTMNFYDKLNTNGIVIMTFKLPKDFTLKTIHFNLALLLKKFNLITARQLFYNRSEITVAVQKKDI